MATSITFFILIDWISNCFETFCNLLIILCVGENPVANGHLFYGMLYDIEFAITWNMIRMASCLTGYGRIFYNICAVLVKKIVKCRR